MDEATARGFAAQAWCDPKNAHKEMDPELAESFARIIQLRVQDAVRDEKRRCAREVALGFARNESGPAQTFQQTSDALRSSILEAIRTGT